MITIVNRSAHARLFAIIVVCALLPAWFFYIGVQYTKTIMVLENIAVANTDAGFEK